MVRVDLKKQEADCRFFGAHDRAWVSFDSVFQLSEEYAWTKPKAHKAKLDVALKELKVHINKIKAKHSSLVIYSDPKVPFNPRRPCLTDPTTSPVASDTVTPAKSTASGKSLLSSVNTSSSQSAGSKPTPSRGRPMRAAATAVKSTFDSEIDDEANSTESEGALVIDTPPTSVSGRKRSAAAVASVPSAAKPSPARPGRKPADQVKATTAEVSPTKRSRASQIDLPDCSPNSRRASIDTPPVLIVDEAPTPASPNRRPGRPPGSQSAMAKQRGRPAVGSSRTPATAMDVVAEETLDQKTRDEIEQLKKEVAQLQKQLVEDREAHNKEIKSIREVIQNEMTLRRSIKDKENNVPAIVLSDSSGDSGKSLSENFKRMIEDTKKQQWCAFCLGKAIYFCCWNTSYCGYECQSKHWPQHMHQCQQHSRSNNNSSTSNANNGTSASGSAASGTSAAAGAASGAGAPNANRIPVTNSHPAGALPTGAALVRNSGNVVSSGRPGTAPPTAAVVGNNERRGSSGMVPSAPIVAAVVPNVVPSGPPPAPAGVIAASGTAECSDLA